MRRARWRAAASARSSPVFCVAIGVMAIVALQLVANSIDAALTVNIRGLNGGDLAVHDEGAGLTQLQLSIFASLKAQGIITAYTPVVSDGGSSATGGGTTGIDLTAYSVWAVDPTVYPLAGPPHFLAPSTTTLSAALVGNGAVISQVLSQQLHAHIGSQLTVTTDTGRTGSVTIAGIIANTGYYAQPDRVSEPGLLCGAAQSGRHAGHLYLGLRQRAR